MIKHLKTFIFISISGLCFAQQDYKNLHEQSLVVDMHTDVLLQVLRGADISNSTPQFQTGSICLRSNIGPAGCEAFISSAVNT